MDGRLAFRSIFLSDVHLGSRRSRAGRLLSFLRAVESPRLYLVGDIADRPPDEAWGSGDALVLHELSRRAQAGTEVIYLPGNHDRGFARAFSRSLPAVRLASEHDHVSADGRSFLVLHGDRFDRVLRHRWLARAGDAAASLWERVAGGGRFRRKRGGRPAGLRAKEALKSLVGYTARFQEAAAALARERGYDGVICGHAHTPGERLIDGVQYLNTGDWVQSCTALVEHPDGRMELVAGEPAPAPAAARAA